MSERALTIVVNPVAGASRGVELAHELVEAVEADGWQASICETAGEGDAARGAKEAVAAGHQVVVAVGGDGTVQEVLAEVVASRLRTRLAHIPAGTTNAIARAFGLTDDPQALAELLRTGAETTIDVGRIEEHDRLFLLMATIGDPSRVVSGAPRALKNRWGMGAYYWAALRAMVWPRHAHVILKCDGRETRGKANGVVLANITRLVEPALVLSPEGSASDGRLDVAIFRTRNVFDWLGVAGRVILRRHGDDDTMEQFQASSCRIECVPTLPVQIDGEMLESTPVTVSVLPGAISLVAPAETSGDPS